MAREVGAPAENVAWTQFMLGEELFMTGNSEAAEDSYRESLKSYPGYHRAIAGLAKIEAARHHYDKAAELYRSAIERIPLPTYAAALGDVYTKMGRHDDARKQFALVEYIAHLSALNKTVYNRELAMFYSDHDIKIAESVALARKELEIRKDIYSWDVLAFALYKNRDYQAAAAADAHAIALGTDDPLLLFHAGVIQHAVGNDRRAIEYLHHALGLNPEFHVLYADVARNDLRDLETKSADAKMKSAAVAQAHDRNFEDAR
jgi:tetratricopeptide (TPR) repeat protein